MNSKLAILFICSLLSSFSLSAQYLDLLENEGGYLFGLRGGPSIGSQNWSGFEMRPLITYNGDLFIESIPVEGKFGLWASLGYHIRGSRINRRNAFSVNGNLFRVPGESFQFKNLSLAAGGKQVFKYTQVADIFYTLGVRLDYNIGTNLLNPDQDELQSSPFFPFYPFENYNWINRITYGVIMGGGMDIPLSEKVGAVILVTASPDFSFQYNQPPIENVIDPFTSGTRTLPERRIRNFTLEVSVGFRFLRKIVYLD